MLARAATWWTILRICLEERLVYRGDFALGTLMRFLPIVTQIFLWTAVFAVGRRRAMIAGYSRDDMIAYYLLTMVSPGVFAACRGWPRASPGRSATARSRSS